MQHFPVETVNENHSYLASGTIFAMQDSCLLQSVTNEFAQTRAVVVKYVIGGKSAAILAPVVKKQHCISAMLLF